MSEITSFESHHWFWSSLFFFFWFREKFSADLSFSLLSNVLQSSRLLCFSFLLLSLLHTIRHLFSFWSCCFQCVRAFCWCLSVFVECRSSQQRAKTTINRRRVTIAMTSSRLLSSRIFRSTVCLCHSAFKTCDFAKTFAMLRKAFSRRRFDAQSTSTSSIRVFIDNYMFVYTQELALYLFVVLNVIVCVCYIFLFLFHFVLIFSFIISCVTIFFWLIELDYILTLSLFYVWFNW